VVSGAVGCAKPQAEIYELVCRAGNFQPADAVFIDDVLTNVEGARSFGMNAIHHRSADETTRVLRTMGFPI
jgi:HAD superfamily hydrolase (TIGR01509 family)